VLAVLSADGKQAATYNDDQTIMIWDMTNAKPPRVYETKGDVSSLVFSPNGNYVASVVNNQKVVVWDLSMDRPAATYESTALSGQSGMEIQFLENGQLMVVDRDLNTQAVTVNIYQTPDTTPLKTFKEDARSFGLVKVAPKDHFLVAVGGGELKVFTLPAGEAIAKMEALLSADNRPMFVFSQDGYNVAVETKGVPQGVIWARVYDLQTGSQNAHCETDFVSVAGMTFSPDGNLLAMIGQSQAGGPYYLEVFDTNGGAQYTDLALDAQTVPLGITFTPDQTQIALMVKGGIQFYRVKQ
jgi:WD40 repeat protein